MNRKQEINLIPQDVVEKIQDGKRIRLWGFVIAMTLIVIFSLFAVEKRNYGTIQEVISDLKVKNQEIEEKLARLSQLQEKRDRLARKQNTIHSLMYKRSLCMLFAEMEKVMGDDLWLNDMEYEDRTLSDPGGERDGDEGVTSTGYILIKDDALSGKKKKRPDGSPVVMQIHGMGVSYQKVADFLERIAQSELFTEIKLNHLKQLDFGTINLVEFEMENGL